MRCWEGCSLVKRHRWTGGRRRPLRKLRGTEPCRLDEVAYSSVLCGTDRKCRCMSRVTTLLVQVVLIIVDRWGSKVVLSRVSRRCLRHELVRLACLGRSSCGLL